MTLGIVILAHRQPSQVGLLVSYLQHPAVQVYLHVDAGVRLEPFLSGLPRETARRTSLLPRFRTRWGSPALVDAALAGLSQAMADGHDFVLLVSGQDLPLWPMERLLAHFSRDPKRSFLSFFPLPDPRWRYDGRLRTDFYTYTLGNRRETCIPRGVPADLSWKGAALNTLLRLWSAFKPPRRFPDYARPFGGSQWWNLSRPAAEYVLRFCEEHPEYRAYHEHTLAPDEIFFQSILLGTGFSHSHEIVNDDLRFTQWTEGSSHPLTLTADHLPDIIASGKPFARKVDMDTGGDLLNSVASHLGVSTFGIEDV